MRRSDLLRRCCWLALAWLLAVMQTAHAEALPLVNTSQVQETGIVHLIHRAQLLEDDAGLSVAEILSLDDAHWQRNAQARTHFGRVQGSIWLRVRLTGLHQHELPLLLRLNYPHLDEIDLYFVNKDSVVLQYLTGDTRTFASRPVMDRIYIFPLKPLTLNNIDLYIRVKTNGPMLIPLDLVTRDEFERSERFESYWIGAYLGVMLIMLFYNFFLFLLVRDTAYLFYLLYVACTASLQFSLLGLGLQYVWPESTSANNIIILLLTILMPLSAILFVVRFLKLLQRGLRLEKLFVKLFILVYLALFIGAFVAPYSLVLSLSHAMSFSAILLGFYFGIAYWRRGVKAAQTFAMAWFVYLIFVMLYLFDIVGLIQPNVISSHALEIGSTLELTLLSIAFGRRINEEKEMRIEAQQHALATQLKLNRDLDGLVRQRTEQLELVNRQLLELSTKDGLTGIYNRRHFDDIFEQEYQRALRDNNWLSVVMLDVDHFKNLNDTYGHPFGDHCLQKIASALKSETRSPPDVVARYGGEEFVVLLPGADHDAARVVSEKIRKRIAALEIYHQDTLVPLTVSVGMASRLPTEAEGVSQMLSQADGRLYQAKLRGRNCVVDTD